MYTLFDKPLTQSPPVLRAANWGYVREGLRQNLQKVIHYYRRAPISVQADHFVTRFLQSITLPCSLPTERYYNNVNGLYALNLSMALGMTSEIFRGRTHDGVFYGPGTTEVLVAHTTDFDPFEAEVNWENLAPIRTLRHPRSDLDLKLLDGRASIETGIAVVLVNVPMLAIQYRAWRKRELYIAETTGDSPRNIGHFVHMYALPNMLRSHLDNALFNRLEKSFTGKTIIPSQKCHSFTLVNWDRKLDQVQQIQLSQLANVTKDWFEALHELPAVSLPTMSDLMRVPRLAPTQQVTWALDLARLPALDFLTTLGERTHNVKNGQELNRIRQSVKDYRSNNTFRKMLPMGDALDAEFELERVAERIGLPSA